MSSCWFFPSFIFFYDSRHYFDNTINTCWSVFIPGSLLLAPHQRVATKDDYVYIPLKGTSTNDKNSQRNNSTSIHTNESSSSHGNANANINSCTPSITATSSSKPPLPKQPPRVVHASVKKDQHGGDADAEQQHHHQRQQRRRKTIDSTSLSAGDGVGGIGVVGRPHPMEPMGLIETDLDTEVTVITSGTNVKTTRSLLDLGPQPRHHHLASQNPPEKSDRPHKSMEFLLDKENLKVVEVRSLLFFLVYFTFVSVLTFSLQSHLLL